jgi:peptide/nickel transport system substrate-binding protein
MMVRFGRLLAGRNAGLPRRAGVVAVAGIAVAAWALPTATSTAATSGSPQPVVTPASTDPPVLKEGGSMIVLEDSATQGADPQGLDPGTNGNGGANEDLEDSIFGGLFELSATGKTVGDLATGYEFLNDRKTVQIDLRHGVEFSDGTPFNAAAVIYNWKRDFQLKSDNGPPWPLAKTNPFTEVGPYTVDINLNIPYSPIVNSMYDKNVNWIGSPTAIKKLGEKQFALTPVGAGPFEVVSDTLDSQLVLKKNPHYWQTGLPYLDSLTFKNVASDESGLEALQSGGAQAYVLMSTLQLVGSFQKAGLQVTTMPGTSPICIQFNTTKAPFNNILAREAMYYATDVPQLEAKLNDNTSKVVEGFTSEGGLFYNPTVPGYRTYDLAKAKALVKQIGGISFSFTGSTSGPLETLDEALASQWEAAGIKVSLNPVDLPTLLQYFASDKWQMTTGGGSWDPATGVGQNDRFLSTAPFTGVHDPHLDALLNKATEVPEDQRGAVYDQVAKYESDKAYVIELYARNIWDVTDKDVSAPGLTIPHPTVVDAPEVWWQYAGYKKS